MKTRRAFVKLPVAEVSDAILARHPIHFGFWFKNPKEPTEEEIKTYFECMLEDLVNCPERLLNAHIEVEEG